jgi:hypothetical protein
VSVDSGEATDSASPATTRASDRSRLARAAPPAQPCPMTEEILVVTGSASAISAATRSYREDRGYRVIGAGLHDVDVTVDPRTGRAVKIGPMETAGWRVPGSTGSSPMLACTVPTPGGSGSTSSAQLPLSTACGRS